MPRPRFARPLAGLLAATLALAACRQAEPAADTDANDSGAPVNAPAPEPVADTIDRAALLRAIAEAASAFAAGTDDRAAQAALDGRPFAVLLPFGCAGVAPAPGDSLSLTLRPGGRSYEVRAAPTIDAAAAGIDVEAEAETPAPIQSVEGFWFRRPWLLAATCPAARGPVVDPAAPQPAPAPAPGDTSAGIARYVAEGESRLGNRAGRDYRKIVTLAEGESPPRGLYLLLEGRLRTWPDGRVIACRDTGAGRPSCIAAAAIDRAAIETIADRSVIAEWTGN